MKPDSTAEKLIRSRVRLVLSQPFFGTLSLRLKLLAGSLSTMATDGSRIVYNPAFVDGLSAAELEGVLAHEVLHCALGHQCRRGGRDPELWNRAADFAINPLLVANGFTLPAGALMDPVFNNLSAEEIYARLPQTTNGGAGSKPYPQQTNAVGAKAGGSQEKPPTVPPDSSSDGLGRSALSVRAQEASEATEHAPVQPGGFGEVWDATDEDGNAASPAEMRRQQHEWGITAEQALRAAKACGSDPAGVERPLSETRQSQQDWRE
ncbi:MAG: vWA domain-containing protein, partial [Terriglobia bacterium]